MWRLILINFAIVSNQLLFNVKFNQPFIDLLLSKNLSIHVFSNINSPLNNNTPELDAFVKKYTSKGVEFHNVPFSRNPLDFISLLKSYFCLRRLFNQQSINIIHTHTPIPSLIARLVKNKTQSLMYTAHGFHFYRGSNILSWLIYYPLERLMVKKTDYLFVLNHEDYLIANKMGFSRVKRIKGIGLDLLKFEVKKGIRKDNRFILVSVGELNRNKNHRTVIKALSKLSNLDFLYLIIGEGKRMDYLKSYSYKLNIQDKVKFYGYLPNPMNIVSGADVFILPSIREGLPVALMEAMALGLPVVASNIRGVKELIIEGYNGYLFGPKMWRELRDKILLVISNKDSHRIMADKNIEILREYELSKVLYNVEEVYDDFISAMVSK